MTHSDARRVKPHALPVAHWLRDARRSAGYSIGQVAAMTGYSRAKLSRWEQGRQVPSRAAIAALTDVYRREHDPEDWYRPRPGEGGMGLV